MFIEILIVILLVIAAILLYVVFGRKDLTLPTDAVIKKYSLPNSKFINWKDTQIHYTESGSGFPILMIHGFGGSNYDFKELDALLNDQYRVIRVDMPGFGLSGFPESSYDDDDFSKVYNEYFAFLLDALQLDAMYVFGNSLGGLMSWNLTVKYPEKVKKLVLFNSAGYEMKQVLKSANVGILAHPIVKLLLKRGLPRFMSARGISRVFYDQSILTPEKITRVNELWNRNGNLKHIMTMTASDKYLDTSVITGITCPTLIIWGKYDKIVPVKYAHYFHRDIKNSKLIIYDCGHVPMMEKPLDVQRDVLQFLHETN